MMYKKAIAALTFCLLLTGCGLLPSNSNSEDDDTTKTETSNKAELTIGYIHLPEDMESADLYDAVDSTTTLAKMFQDEPVTVYAMDGDFASVSYGGITGYVELQYLSFTKPTGAEATDETTTAKADSAEDSTVNAPTAGNAAIEQNINIFLIYDDDGFGYIKPTYYSDYTADTRNAWCSATSVYIYSQPDTNSAKREANMLYYGDELTVLGSTSGWYYISTDSGSGYDLHGYVNQRYITYGDSPAAEEPVSATHGRVNVGSANVRSSPSKETDENILFTLYQGDEFDVISYDGYWYKINYNGSICYISHKMVDVW